MPDIKLRDGSGVEQTYTGVDTITVPLADGSGTWTYGLTDEELTFKGYVGDYALSFGFGQKILDKYHDRIKFIDLKECQHIFASIDSLEKDYIGDFVLNANDLRLQSLFGTFESRRLPKIVGKVSRDSSNCQYPFRSGWRYVKDPSELIKMIEGIDWSNCTEYNFYSWFEDTYALRGTGFPTIFYDLMRKWNSSNYCPYESLYYNAYALDEALDIPVFDVEMTSNKMGSFCNRAGRVKNIVFETDSGTPKKVKWKSQTINLTNYVGYMQGNVGELPSDFKWSDDFLATDNVCYDYYSTGLDGVKKRYNELKNSNNWYSSGNMNIPYNGSSVYLSLLFSRYNHGSMVATINSLPDTSEYLASAGGTNTIKFKKYMGDLTDGGGASNLTEQEIAVAAAKGWTVSIVN